MIIIIIPDTIFLILLVQVVELSKVILVRLVYNKSIDDYVDTAVDLECLKYVFGCYAALPISYLT